MKILIEEVFEKDKFFIKEEVLIKDGFFIKGKEFVDGVVLFCECLMSLMKLKYV